jgi:hypothetical protein
MAIDFLIVGGASGARFWPTSWVAGASGYWCWKKVALSARKTGRKCYGRPGGCWKAIRRRCGLSMRIIRYPLALVGFGFAWPGSLPVNTPRLWLNKDRLQSGILGMVAGPLPEGKGAGLIPMWPEVTK